MTTITKAQRATITVGDVELDVFQLPDGSYQISQSQTTNAVNKPPKRMVELAQSERGQILIQSGFEKGLKVKVAGSKPVNLIPIEVAFQFWVLELAIGNRDALALVIACGVEALERRADAAFNVIRTEEERNERFIVRKDSVLQRNFWTDSIKWYIDNHPELSDSAKRFLYSNVSNTLNRALFGMTAKEIRVVLDMADSENIRDCINPAHLPDITFLEKYAGTRVKQGLEPMQAIKEAIAFCNYEVRSPR